MGKFQDLTNRRFGRWVVLERGPDHITTGGYKFTTWKCVCDCGTVSNVIAGRLLSGKSLSCGCLQRDTASQFEDLSGNKYNRLLVLKRDEECNKKIKYICQCDCGNIVSVRADSLKSGTTKSCGCLHKESATLTGLDNIKHGGARRNYSQEEKRLYNIWGKIKDRCGNVNSSSYERYGGNGISYCDDWKDFKPFQIWALNNGYANNLTIDRIDNTKGYSPENCRWVDYTVQNNNRSNSIHIIIDGVDHTLPEWCRISGIPYKVAYARLRAGWDEKEAVFKEVKRNDKVS